MGIKVEDLKTLAEVLKLNSVPATALRLSIPIHSSQDPVVPFLLTSSFQLNSIQEVSLFIPFGKNEGPERFFGAEMNG